MGDRILDLFHQSVPGRRRGHRAQAGLALGWIPHLDTGEALLEPGG